MRADLRKRWEGLGQEEKRWGIQEGRWQDGLNQTISPPEMMCMIQSVKCLMHHLHFKQEFRIFLWTPRSCYELTIITDFNCKYKH